MHITVTVVATDSAVSCHHCNTNVHIIFYLSTVTTNAVATLCSFSVSQHCAHRCLTAVGFLLCKPSWMYTVQDTCTAHCLSYYENSLTIHSFVRLGGKNIEWVMCAYILKKVTDIWETNPLTRKMAQLLIPFYWSRLVS